MARGALIPPKVPNELYQYIIQHISDPNLLAALCTASKILRHEAELILYREIRLTDCRRILSWCLAVSRSVHLGTVVRSLSLPHWFESIPDNTAAQIRTKLRGTLLLMTNLKYVSITAGHAFRYPGLDVS